ncbi:type II toxin-antitoxin system HicA family toxin [Patescibacteria group bacterium]|nr:type II toxin-antitoxin system HicA family toxin [Patescibacteria group bacterium]
MPKLYSSKHTIKILLKNDFVKISQRGGHIKFAKKHKRKTITVIVPDNKKQIPIGTFHSILRQSELTKKHFKK